MAHTETKTDNIPVGEGTESKLTIRHPFPGFEEIDIVLPSGKTFNIKISDHEEWIEISEGESKWTTDRSIFASPKSISLLRIGLIEIRTKAERDADSIKTATT